MTDRVLGWTLFVAAMTSNQDLRSQLISMVHNLAFHNISGGAFPDHTFVNGTIREGYLFGVARWVNCEFVSRMATEIAIMVISPAQGAMFAPLALKLVQSAPIFFMAD